MTTDNNILDMVRENARHLNIPQSNVAAQWKSKGLLNKHYLSTCVAGMTMAEYREAKIVLTRLAKVATSN